MDVVGIGLDLVDLPRFEKLYQIDDREVLNRCFTVHELATVGSDFQSSARLAGRFAAKEATLKVLGGLQQGISMTDIEVRATGKQPQIILAGGALEAAAVLGILHWHLSITHNATAAAAVVVAMR